MEFLNTPDVALEQYRREFVLREPRLRHYEEFADFLRRRFQLSADDADNGRSVYFRAENGRLYEMTFLAGSGGPFPSGLELFLLVAGLEPAPEPDEIDADVWRLLRWLVEGVGGEWTLERFDRMVGLYGLPFGVP
jgi:hypothetical protein